MKARPWSWAFPALLGLQVFSLCLFRMHDPDTWWHLRTGRWILENGRIPGVDIWSWTIEGKPWVTFEWLSQVLFHLIHSAGGDAALISFKAALITAAFLVLLKLCGEPFLGTLALGAAALVTRGTFMERPQAFDFLLLPLFVLLVEGPPRRGLFWLLPALELLWVNLHGGAALLGAGTVGLRFVQALVWKREEAKEWAALSALCLLAMLGNPHGWKVFTHLVETLSFPGRELINEWRPLGSFFSPWGLFYAGAVMAVAARGHKEPLLSALVAGLGVMGAGAVRHLPLFTLLACPLIVRAAVEQGWGRLSGLGAPARAGAALAALAVGTWLYADKLTTYSRHLAGFGRMEYPKGAAEYIRSRDLRGRMFNTYGIGGYLIWKLGPERKVFIDGRNVEYGPERVRESATWMRAGGWAALDAEHRFDYAVMENGDSYHCWQLDRDPAWGLAYWDDAALVYVRRDGANAEALKADEYRLLTPNHLSFGYLNEFLHEPKKAEAALAEIERSIRSAEQNVSAYQMKAYVAAELGRREEARAAVEEAVRRFPFKASPYLSLGWFHERGGELDRAFEAYQRAARVARREDDWVARSVALNNLGVVELKRGRPGEAEGYFEKSLEVNPGFGEARRHLEKLRAG